MQLSFFKNTLFKVLPLLLLICFSCGSQNSEDKGDTSRENAIEKKEDIEMNSSVTKRTDQLILTGAEQPKEYSYLLAGKNIAVVANPTSKLYNYAPEKYANTHLVDFLVGFGVKVTQVFAPEHGFRGTADAGEMVKDGVDTKTGLPIISLHGKNKKPTQEHLEGIDAVVFDIQDVGVRFYTYISTMHYVMEACAEKGIPLIILDRPNPNGHYVDGPTMKPEHTSFLGLHTIPLVHGMTIGEYAQMINGEGWLKDRLKCDISVIQMQHYSRNRFYSLPDRPSPNLPNDVSINLYPSLGLLEGTSLNAGRGTEMQFQIMGSPLLPADTYTFEYTPQPNFGAKYPKHKGVVCNGIDLRETSQMNQVDLTWIIQAYQNFEDKSQFFNTKNFTAHAGTELLQEQIEAGKSMAEIRKSWQVDLEAFKKIRAKYLIYD